MELLQGQLWDEIYCRDTGTGGGSCFKVSFKVRFYLLREKQNQVESSSVLPRILYIGVTRSKCDGDAYAYPREGK